MQRHGGLLLFLVVTEPTVRHEQGRQYVLTVRLGFVGVRVHIRYQVHCRNTLSLSIQTYTTTKLKEFYIFIILGTVLCRFTVIKNEHKFFSKIPLIFWSTGSAFSQAFIGVRRPNLLLLKFLLLVHYIYNINIT